MNARTLGLLGSSACLVLCPSPAFAEMTTLRCVADFEKVVSRLGVVRVIPRYTLQNPTNQRVFNRPELPATLQANTKSVPKGAQVAITGTRRPGSAGVAVRVPSTAITVEALGPGQTARFDRARKVDGPCSAVATW